LSNAKPAVLAISTVAISFLGKEAYITTSGLYGPRLVKNFTPSQTSPMSKRVRALK
jgi:hypothetical protein